MIEIYDVHRKKTAVLQNAFDVVETEELNKVGSLRFSLPDDDPKIEFCGMLHYASYSGGQMYRILTQTRERGDTGVVTFECEHVIGTLIDDVLFGSFTVGNLGVYTRDSINFVLSKQTVTRWVLDECDFTRQFEYGWSNENLLNALFSIPRSFADYYMWKYDTSVFPWKISLKLIDATARPTFYIQDGRNFLASSEKKMPDQVCTRLYPLGYGEGVNQLTIKDVNGGVPYIQSPQNIVEQYSDAPICRIWADRRFEDAQSLKERAQAILQQYQEPIVTREFSLADVYDITADEYDRAAIGKIVMFKADGTKTYITKIERNHDEAGDSKITIASKGTDIVEEVTDLAERMRIQEVYAQGATQLYAVSIQANATPSKAAVLRFYLPEEMRIINKVLAKITLDAFRSYSQSTDYQGDSTETSSAGGAYADSSERTSSAGGGELVTSDPSSTRSSSSLLYSIGKYTDDAGSHNHGGTYSGGSSSYLATSERSNSQVLAHTHNYYMPTNHTHGIGSSGSHSHRFTVDLAHTHDISHTHTVTPKSHTHRVSMSISIPDHTHTVSIPGHRHDIVQGIFEFGSPSGARIVINGVQRMNMAQDAEANITAYLVGSDNKIPRGSWQEIEIYPNDLAYITIDLYVQGFVQSRGGSTY